MTIKQPQIMIEEVTDPVELEQTRAQDVRFARNSDWFEARASEIYTTHRGECICIAGEELFVADPPEEVLALATTAHPHDYGRFTRLIPFEQLRSFLYVIVNGHYRPGSESRPRGPILYHATR